MHKGSYQYQNTGKVKAYKKMTDQAARALNWILAEQGANSRWVVQVLSLSDEAKQVAESAQRSTEAELLRTNGPAPIPLLGIQQNTATYLEKKAV